METEIKNIIEESIAVKRKVADQLVNKIRQAAEQITQSYNQGGKLLLFGNGGSAADAQHIACELIHQFEISRRKCLLALALNTNTSVATAIGNDWSFEEIFERQVEGLANPEDVVIGISTSGNSANVVRGLRQANDNGAFTIALGGKDGGKIAELANLAIIVPSDNTARIQESHIMIGHIIC